MDILFLRLLARYVTIVPCLAKCDTLSIDERERYLDEHGRVIDEVDEQVQLLIVYFCAAHHAEGERRRH
jgi:septin family protein